MSIVLEGRITEINHSRVRIQIVAGTIKIDEEIFTIRTGHVYVLFKKFDGWSLWETRRVQMVLYSAFTLKACFM